MKGINFNLKHSYTDFCLIMNYKKIGTPAKKKIKVDAPFMNGSYDFSTFGSNGEITYTQRSITVKFTLVSTSKVKLQIELTKILEWLQDTGQQKLIFDDIKDYFFMAEVEDNIEVIEKNNTAEIIVKFTADPFKVGVNYATNNLWDTFNFEEDYLQESDYDVVTTKSITVYNPGRLVMPIINCSVAMSVLYNGITYNLNIGDNKLYGLKLQNGSNSIVINGTGHIKILFRKVNL